MEDNNRSRILVAAYNLFNNRGYRSVTVQDLATELGMSKKTLYQYFNGKEEIAAAVIEEKMKSITEFIKKFDIEKSDPLLIIREIILFLGKESLRFGPLFLMDIEKYLPNLAYKYKGFREESKQVLEYLLKRAHEMGKIKDVPTHLIMQILNESLRTLVKPEFLSQNPYSKTEVIETFIDIFFSGIVVPEKCSVKGD